MAMTDFAIIRRSMTARLFSTVTTIITVEDYVAATRSRFDTSGRPRR